MDDGKFSDENFEVLINQIRDNKCILFIGPEVLKTTSLVNYKQELLQFLNYPNNDAIKSYFEEDELFLFKDNQSRDGICFQIKKYLRSNISKDIFNKIADIPFHLIISEGNTP